MCLDDGPGIRTTVFMKGCTVRCPWCSNPENIEFEAEKFSALDNCVLKSEKCLFEECKYFGSLCEAAGIYGKEYSVDELTRILMADKSYYDKTGGGITFSGGEALAHYEYLKQVLHKLKNSNVHIAI